MCITSCSMHAGRRISSSWCLRRWSPPSRIAAIGSPCRPRMGGPSPVLPAASDGVRSLFREKLIGDGEPRPIGYVANRTIVPIAALTTDVPRDQVLLWRGPRLPRRALSAAPQHAFHYRRRVRTSTCRRGDAATYQAELEATIRDAYRAARAQIAMIDLAWRRPIADRDPVRHWHRGRIVLSAMPRRRRCNRWRRGHAWPSRTASASPS